MERKRGNSRLVKHPREKNPRWQNPRKKCTCFHCDRYRPKTSHKRGLYRVYMTYGRIILSCFTCKREQKFKVIKEQLKEIKEKKKGR